MRLRWVTVRAAAAALVVLPGLLAGCASAPTPESAASAAPPATSAAATLSQPSTPAASTPAAPTPARTAVAAATPCDSNTGGRLVYVSIARQHLWMCAGHTVAHDTAITSGIVGEYTNTPTGHYTIQSKVTDTTLTLNTGATYAVKYWIPFDAPLFGFHDSSWQTFPYGSQRYRTEGSHGCVHMPLAAIAQLYRWAPIGTPVTIV